MSGHMVSPPEKTACSLASECPGCLGEEAPTLPTGPEGDYGPWLRALQEHTHTPQHIKVSPWFLILMTVAGSPPPLLGQRFHSDVWNRSETGIVVPGKLPQKDQVFQHILPLFL